MTFRILPALAALLLLGVSPTNAQRFKIEPKRPQSASHNVQIINEMGFSIRLKLMGYQDGANYVLDMRPGQRVQQRLYAGQRVICIWDRKQHLRVAANVTIDRGGELRLRPIERPNGQQPRGKVTPMGGQTPLPQLKIE